MRTRVWTIVAGLASAAALVAVPSALAAYTSPKLEVRQTGNVVAVKASQAPDDDATAVVRIQAPAGAALTTTQAAGTVLGSVRALVIATALGGAQLPIEGQVVVAGPGQVPAATIQACLGGVTPAAVWLLALSAAGQQLAVPMFVLANPATIQVCLPHPSTATFGAKLVTADFSVSGVFGPVSAGAWVSVWVPWDAAGTAVNQAGTVASPAAIGAGAVTVAARTRARGALVSGRVTQAGQARAGATVTIFGGARRTGLRRLGRAQVRANGAYTFTARAGTFFRVTAVAAAAAAPPLCTALGPTLAPIPCVNPTTSGFTVQSRVVRKR
jgi:hypothetical protein